MKATLTYDLNDPDDQLSHLRAVRSTELAVCLWEIFHNTHRGIERKIENEQLKDPYEVLDAFRSEVSDILNANGINIDNLIN